MSTAVLQKYKSLRPINDEETVNKMLQILVDTPRDRIGQFYGASAKGGRFYLLENEAFPNRVIEYVPGMNDDDSVTTLYEGNPVFHSRQQLIEAREELIREIEYALMAVPGATVVFDQGRERDAHLFELGTAQLIDVLAHFAQKSPVILT